MYISVCLCACVCACVKNCQRINFQTDKKFLLLSQTLILGSFFFYAVSLEVLPAALW